MNAAKTSTERHRDYKANRQRQGLKEVRNLWAHPDDHAAIKALAERLRRGRSSGLDNTAGIVST